MNTLANLICLLVVCANTMATYSSPLPNASYKGQSVYIPSSGLIQGSSQTNPNYMNYQGSLTYAPKSVPQQIPYQTQGAGYVAPPITQSKPSGDILGASTQRTSGGNISYQDALNKGFDWNNLPSGYSQQVSGPSDADIMAAIDSSYGASAGYLNQAEQNLRGDYPTITAEIQKQNEANQAQLTANKQKTISGVEKNVSTAKTRKEDALAQARRLYAELQKGNVQRFGGVSSAGQAVSELQGAEAQRQFGATNRDFSTFMKDIEAQKAQIETDFNASLLNLKTQADSAINQATRDFQNKLLEINRLRAENESNKSAKRLEALMNLKNQVFSINQQNTVFQQQLQAMKYQQMLELDTYQKKAAVDNSPAYNQRSITSNLKINTAPQTTTTPQYTGAIAQQYSPTRKDNLYQGMF